MSEQVNARLLACAKRLVPKYSTPEQDWHWKNMRTLLWLVIRHEILPEFGITPEAPKDPKEAKEYAEMMQAAWQAWNTALDKGYTVESSNCGKELAAHGICAKRKEKTAGVTSTEAP